MTKTIHIIYLAFSLLLGVMPRVLAQDNEDKTKSSELAISQKQMRKQRPTYITVGVGSNSSTFRDFATSPLIYEGNLFQLSLSKLKKDYNRESEFGFSYDFGSYETTFNDNITTSKVNRIELFYSKLFCVNQLSSNKYNTKIGYQINNTLNFRYNEDLLNNAVGIEMFTNLMGSIQFTKDISRKQAKEKKIWFIKYKLDERKRDLALRLNVGLVNSTFRNGYIYGNQSGLLNSPTPFDGYEYKLFSGLRVGSRVDYTCYLKNKNAIQLSYLWDAYKTGGELDKFEMAHHTLRFALLFNTNNH